MTIRQSAFEGIDHSPGRRRGAVGRFRRSLIGTGTLGRTSGAARPRRWAPRFESLEPRTLLAGDLIISEFMASNGNTLADEDGDFEDWIEIHNPTLAPVDLAGWSLTDDASDLTKWPFPSETIAAGGHLLVFASGKDRAIPGAELHANFALNAGGEYLGLIEPDGSTVSHEFAPQFPPQISDVSYGYTQQVTRLVESETVQSGAGGGNVLVPLQNATATFSQNVLPVHLAIDGKHDRNVVDANHGWAIAPNGPNTAVFETVDDVGFAGGTELTFRLINGGYNQGSHTIGRFRLSVTTDDRSTFADGQIIGGDVTANWIVIEPDEISTDNGGLAGNDTLLTLLPDNSILASGPQALNAIETYTVRVTTDLVGITGIRLEVMEDPSLPLQAGGTFQGPGRSTSSANFVLREITLDAESVLAKVPLQNATAAYSQAGFSVGATIDGIYDGLPVGASGGWANDTSGPNVAVFETVSDIDGFAGGTELAFKLVSGGYGQGSHTLGRFRLSATTDDRSTFADGFDIGGDVDANWTVLDPIVYASDNGSRTGNSTRLTKLSDNSILVSGLQADSTVETYAVHAVTNLTGITGFRLEMLTDPSLPSGGTFNGPGRSSNGNYVLREFAVSANEFVEVIEEGQFSEVLIPDASDAALGTSWTQIGFVTDADWQTAPIGIGFETELPVSQTAYGYLAGAAGTQGVDVSLGHDFDVHTPIVVSSLGVFDSGADGLALTLSASIWSIGGTKLAELTFTPGDPGTLVDSSRFKPLDEPLLLEPGSYTVMAYGYGPAEPNGNEGTGGPFADHKFLNDGGGVISFVGSARHSTVETTGQFPAIVDGGPADRYSAGTFVYSAPAFYSATQTNIASSMHTVNASAYLRVAFPVDDPGAFDWLTLRMKYDDGFVAYLNGVEVARRSAPETLAWDSAATASRPVDDAIRFEDISMTSHLGELVAGTNVLAIHGLNVDAADGDFLIAPELLGGTALGVDPRYLEPPTPGAPNATTADFEGLVEDTKFSVDRGVFSDPIQVEITTQTENAEIYYTIDGSAPNPEDGFIYTGPIDVTTTTTLRAIAVKDGFRPTNVDTQTYLYPADVLNQVGIPAGYPTSWNGATADYGVSPDPFDVATIAGNPGYTPEEYTPIIVESLLSLPTMSITMDIADLFGSQGGIYANPLQDGPNWERPVSVEYILPDGSEGFQIDAGLRIMGFTSRNPIRTWKHSFRILFKEQYGDGRLNYPLFGDSTVDSINTIALRANTGDNWASFDSYSGSASSYVRDQWAKSIQRLMGQPAIAGEFVHLYLNGIYWGIYNPTERPDAAFASETFGKEVEDYDSVKFCCPDQVVDGEIARWRELLSFAQAGLESDAAYQRIQGNNPDGTRNEDFDVLIDIDNFIDYVISGQYQASFDWPGNYYVFRDRTSESDGFKFINWDTDLGFSLSDLNKDKTVNDNAAWWSDSPGEIDLALRANPEYRLRFADRVQKHYFHDGALTPEAAAELYANIADEIRGAIIAESLRWGDTTGELFTPDVWEFTVRDMLDFYFPNRGDVVLDQLRGHNLFPDVLAPEYNVNAVPQHGGAVVSGDVLSIVTPPSPPILQETTLVGSFADARSMVPIDGELDSTESGVAPVWTETTFDDSTWTDGQTGVGFDTGTAFDSLIRTDFQSEMYFLNTSVYIRVPFEYDGTNYDDLTLRMKYDDGFVAYLNGVLVASSLAPGEPFSYLSTSSAQHAEAAATIFEDFDLTPFMSLLAPGSGNVLAIHGLNRSLDSTDLLMLPELIGGVIDADADVLTYFTTDGSDPRRTGGAVSGTAAAYDQSFALTESTVVKARTLVGTEWSPLSEALFVVDTPLRVNEIYFNPPGSDESTEFIELLNTSATATLDLTGVTIEGIGGYQFLATDANVSLAPGARMVVVKDLAAFAAAYPQVPASVIAQRPFGPSSLANDGETIALRDAAGAIIQQFTYNDQTSEGWYDEADGDGSSLVVVDIEGDYSDPATWRPSALAGGSPGTADPEPLVADANRDGSVDRADVAIVLRHLGTPSGARPTTGDVNGDGAVNLVDLAMTQAALGSSVAPAPVAAAAAAVNVLEGDAAAEPVGIRRAAVRARRVIDPARFDQRTGERPQSTGIALLEDSASLLRRASRRIATARGADSTDRALLDLFD